MSLTLRQRLAKAEAAYDAIMCGESVAEVRDSNGESVRYTSANASRLKAYIAELKAEIRAEDSGSGTARLPLRPIFS
jgi:hypothetical protein